jgi:hypothetical protein
MKLFINIFRGQHKYLHLLSLFFVLCSCEQNKYVDGKKDGNWTEYLDSSRVSEVTEDSAIFLRKIKYNEGMPEGMVSDSYLNSTKSKFEFYLISGPYLENKERPEDKFIGVVKEFDEKNDKIINFNCFDQFGVGDPKTYFVKGFDLLKDDKRFDSLYFSSLHGKENKLQSMQKFHNRPELFDKESARIIAQAYANPSIKKLIKEDENNVFLYGILMDALGENGKYFKIFFDLEKQIAVNVKNEKQVQEQSITIQTRTCKWCGKPFESLGLYCSRKCEYEEKNR